MKLSIISPFIALATGCGVGVTSDPTPVSEDPSAMDGSGKTECDAASGPLHPFTTGKELEALLVGRWRHCSGPTFPFHDDPGVEFVLEGHKYFLLVDDGHGDLVRRTGFDSEGTWETHEQDNTAQLIYHPIPNGFAYGYPQFEDVPRRFTAFLHTAGFAVYVAIP